MAAVVRLEEVAALVAEVDDDEENAEVECCCRCVEGGFDRME